MKDNEIDNVLQQLNEQHRSNVVTYPEEAKQVIVDALIHAFNTDEELEETLNEVGFDWTENIDDLYKLVICIDEYGEIENFEIVQSEGGDVGGGEYVLRVVKVTSPITNNIAYFKVAGCYDSYKWYRLVR